MQYSLESQSSNTRAAWRDSLRYSTWVTCAWEWMQMFLGRLAEPILWVTMVFSCYLLVPGAALPSTGVISLMFVLQFIGLDVAGMGLYRTTLEKQLAKESYPSRVAFILIGLTLVTVSYAGLKHVLSMPQNVTLGLETFFTVSRSVMTVLYSQVLHTLKVETGKQASRNSTRNRETVSAPETETHSSKQAETAPETETETEKQPPQPFQQASRNRETVSAPATETIPRNRNSFNERAATEPATETEKQFQQASRNTLSETGAATETRVAPATETHYSKQAETGAEPETSTRNRFSKQAETAPETNKKQQVFEILTASPETETATLMRTLGVSRQYVNRMKSQFFAATQPELQSVPTR